MAALGFALRFATHQLYQRFQVFDSASSLSLLASISPFRARCHLPLQLLGLQTHAHSASKRNFQCEPSNEGHPGIAISVRSRDQQQDKPLQITVLSSFAILKGLSHLSADRIDTQHLYLGFSVAVAITGARLALLALWPEYKAATNKSNRQVGSSRNAHGHKMRFRDSGSALLTALS